MKITRRIVVLDAADIAAASSFWARLLGGTVDDRQDDWHNVVVDGVWTLGIQRAPDHTPPEWPTGRQQQIHLDLWVDDLAAAHDHALNVGLGSCNRQRTPPPTSSSSSTPTPPATRSASAGTPKTQAPRGPAPPACRGS